MPKGVYQRAPRKPFNPTKITVNCRECNAELLKVPSAVKRWSGICKPCTAKARIGKSLPDWWVARSKASRVAPTGEQHHAWKGGITDPDKIQRVRFKQTTQKQVLTRDEYTCQICYVTGVYLHVDHINKWSDYPELRFEADNCRTLCVPCHYYVTFKRKMPHGSTWGYKGTVRC